MLPKDIKSIDQKVKDLLETRLQLTKVHPELETKRSPILTLIEHDDEGTIHQTVSFPNSAKGKRAAIKHGCKIIENTFEEEHEAHSEEGESEECNDAKATFKKTLNYVGFSNAVTIK